MKLARNSGFARSFPLRETYLHPGSCRCNPSTNKAYVKNSNCWT